MLQQVEILRFFCYKDELVLFKKIFEEFKKLATIGNWENKKQKPSKIQENIRNGPIKIYHRFL